MTVCAAKLSESSRVLAAAGTTAHLIVISLLSGTLLSTPAHAIGVGGGVMAQQTSSSAGGADSQGELSPGAPALVEADEMDYDRERNIVTASGSVSVVQGDTVLMTDVLEYHRDSGEVFASGHVSMLEPSGHVYFADRVQLKHEMSSGVIEHFKARMSDGSLIAASYAERLSADVTHLFRAAYTPCYILCGEDGPKPPMWSINADKVVYDQAAQEVTYRDAYFNAFGVPVIYTPYLSHPTPGADNQSGFLMPQYRYSTNLGSTYRAPYYQVFGQDKDATITPVWTSVEGLLLLGQYRQAFDSGPLKIDGSLTRPQNRDAFGNLSQGRQTRGYVEATGRFDINDEWKWGFDARRATDQTYLRRYFNDPTPVLNSRAYVQGFGFTGNERTYAGMQGLSFQGLQNGADPDKIPLIFPLVDFSMQTDEASNGSRFSLDGNLMSLTRDDGAGSRRLAALGRWNLPYLTENGQLIQLGAQLRADIYAVNDVILSDGRGFAGTTGRLVPEINALWRWPFVNRLGPETSWIVEPTVALALSPNGGNPEKIPNEDSQIPEFTDANLFAFNRFSGWDRIESGPRVTYGVRSELAFAGGKRIDALIGQEYRYYTDRLFPFSNDPDSHVSDYVGRLGLVYDPFNLDYRFRYDRERLAPKRHEVDIAFRRGRFGAGISYLSLQNDSVLASAEEITLGADYKLTDYWKFSVGGRKNLEINQLTQVGVGLEFKNECVGILTVLAKDYTRDRDVEPDTSISVQLTLQNLGSP